MPDSRSESMVFDIEKALEALRQYADERKIKVMLLEEPPQLAALLVNEYGKGLAKAAEITGDTRAAALIHFKADELSCHIDDT